MSEEAYRQEVAPRSPERGRKDLASWIRGSVANCAKQAASEMRYGEIRVVVNRELKIAANTDGRGHLAETDRVCVEAAAGEAVREVTGRLWWQDAFLDKPLGVYVTLGGWPPLFPVTANFATDWLAAVRSKVSRRRFQEQLPAEVVFEDDGCLSLPRRDAFDLGLGSWLMGKKPFAELWQASAPAQNDGVLGGARPSLDEMRRAYWLGDDGVLIHHKAADEWYRQEAMRMNQKLTVDTARQKICLRPLDGELRRQIRSHIDQRGTCWAGDLGEILVYPHTEFPIGRRFKTVGVGRTRACAIDDGGALTCCGERLPEDPPAQAYSQVAVGDAFDCGVTTNGSLRCWGRAPPVGTGAVPGSFQQVAIDRGQVCAIRHDTRALECWDAKGGHLPAALPDRGRAVTFMSEGPCALLENGGIFCVGSRQDIGRDIGPFRSFAADQKIACGVVAASNREVRCWRLRDDSPRWTAERGPQRSLLPKGDEPAHLALTEADRCVLGTAGHVACWQESGAKVWDGLYGALAARAGRLCAVTLDGNVRCDHGWP